MTITYVQGDATRPLGEGPRILVHVNNDIGAWGKGFVLALSRRWPEPEEAFRSWYAGETELEFALGAVQFVAVGEGIEVANLVGQHKLRGPKGRPPVRYWAIREGLGRVRARALERGASVHMPRIACGLAGGTWERVGAIVKEELSNFDVPVSVYDFG